MKFKEISEAREKLQKLKAKYAYHHRYIDILKGEYWDPYEHYYIDKDIWERQKIEEIKSEGQILKRLEIEIRNQRKIVKNLDREINKLNNGSKIK